MLACWYVQPVRVGVCRQAGGSVNSPQQDLGIIHVAGFTSLSSETGPQEDWLQLLDLVFKCAGKWLHTQTPLPLQLDELLGPSRKCWEKNWNTHNKTDLKNWFCFLLSILGNSVKKALILQKFCSSFCVLKYVFFLFFILGVGSSSAREIISL